MKVFEYPEIEVQNMMAIDTICTSYGDNDTRWEDEL